MKKAIIYRNGSMTLQERIAAALAHYSQHNDALPAAVAVNPKDLDAATAHVKALDLTLPVTSNGGALSGEVWLVVADENGGVQ